MAEKVLVIEAVRGRIVESRVVEGDFIEVLKSVAKEALDKWDPSRSFDFMIVREDREWELRGDEDPELVSLLEGLGLVREVEGKRVAVVPFYYISYENKAFGEAYYEDYALYAVTLYLCESYRVLIEEDLADYTRSRMGEAGQAG